MNFNEEQRAALDLIRSGRNVFLSGAGGTGKTSIIREAIRGMQNVVLLAPTGGAALNIGGQTIHSFARLDTGLLCPDTIPGVADPRYRRMLNAVQTIVIDEISLTRSDLFAALDHRFRDAATDNRRRLMPWAGKQVVVLGDFLQLPPVITSGEEELFTESRLNGPYAFSPPLWRESNFVPVLLNEVQRQHDPLLLKILSDIRIGNLDERDIMLPDNPAPMTPIEALNHLCVAPTQNDYRGMILCATRAQAERINAFCTSRLKSEKTIFRAEIDGRFLEPDFPTSEALTLREGQRVIAVANCRQAGGGYVYTNGDFGTVTRITIDDHGRGHVLVDFDNGNVVEVAPYEWKKYRFETEYDRNSGRDVIKRIEVGAFRQIPLRSGYAATIHKAQGQTFEEMTVDVGSGCFAPGQLYTALSRCRSLDTLHLTRPIRKEDVLVSQDALSFYRHLVA